MSGVQRLSHTHTPQQCGVAFPAVPVACYSAAHWRRKLLVAMPLLSSGQALPDLEFSDSITFRSPEASAQLSRETSSDISTNPAAQCISCSRAILLYCRFFPSQAWQDYYYAGLRDHFHYHRDIIANASKIVHYLHSR